MSFEYSSIIPDHRVIQTADFLLAHPDASLDDLCKELELGWSMASTLYREAALKYITEVYGKEAAKPIRDAFKKLAPPCTQHP